MSKNNCVEYKGYKIEVINWSKYEVTAPNGLIIGATDALQLAMRIVDEDIRSEITYKDREELVKSMNNLIRALNNEGAYYNHWILVVPDEASDDDFEYIARDEDLYKETCELFRDLIGRYGRDGFYACNDKEAY